MKKRLMLLIILSFIFSSCAMNHHPNLVSRKIPVEQLQKLDMKNPVAIMNNCQQKGDIDFCKLVIVHHFWSDYYKVTDIATNVLIDAISQMGIQENKNAEKKLKLSIDKVSCREVSWLFEISVVLNVELSDGRKFQFVDEQKFGNAYALTPAFEIAIRECIIKLLKNDQILTFFSKSE